jgi:hypothetical protein
MGFFSSITGQDDRNDKYLSTLNRCLWKINEKADHMNVNLSDYYNTRNVINFQESSIFFFLAAAAVFDQDLKEKNFLIMPKGEQKALNTILNDFLRNNGIKGMDLGTSFRAGASASQVSFGRDYIIAEKTNTYNPDDVMSLFIKSLVDQNPYNYRKDINYK